MLPERRLEAFGASPGLGALWGGGEGRRGRVSFFAKARAYLNRSRCFAIVCPIHLSVAGVNLHTNWARESRAEPVSGMLNQQSKLEGQRNGSYYWNSLANPLSI